MIVLNCLNTIAMHGHQWLVARVTCRCDWREVYTGRVLQREPRQPRLHCPCQSVCLAPVLVCSSCVLAATVQLQLRADEVQLCAARDMQCLGGGALVAAAARGCAVVHPCCASHGRGASVNLTTRRTARENLWKYAGWWDSHFASCLSSPLLLVSWLLERTVLCLYSLSILALGAGGVLCSPCLNLAVKNLEVLPFHLRTTVGPSDVSPPAFLVTQNEA